MRRSGWRLNAAIVGWMVVWVLCLVFKRREAIRMMICTQRGVAQYENAITKKASRR
ncbi:MAG: hypothetical protein ABFD89_01515 [Bryobacteraceae bacterium]